MNGNVISIPVDQSGLFAEVIRQFQETGLAFNVVVVGGDFQITITGH